MYSQIIDALKNATTIGIFVHINPDGDAIGSALALYAFLKNAGKVPMCFSDDMVHPVPERLQFLPNSSVFNTEKPTSFDVSIALDLGETHRIGNNAFEFFKKGKKKLCVDHHPANNTDSFTEIAVVEPSSVSTTQIIYKILAEWDINLINAEIAECIYAGILTDSGGFQFSATSEETFLITANLKRYAFDTAEVSRLLMRNMPLRTFLLTNRVLEKTRFFDGNKIAVATFLKEDFAATGTTEEDAEAVNNLINISEVILAATIVEIGERAFKISVRSKGTASAAAVAKCFGGGGHFAAAGCRAYGYLEDVIEKFVGACRDILS